MQTGVYQHYKGEYYLLLGVGQHTETGETLVLYIPLTGNEGRPGKRIRCRPLSGPDGWNTFVEHQHHMTERFKYIGDEMPVVELQIDASKW